MAMVTVTSPCNTNISQTFALETNKNHLRDSSSFSSYLNVADETFVLTLPKANPNLNSLISNPNEDFYLGGKKNEDGEIGVFDAKKYFNEESPKITKEGDMKNPPIDIAPVNTKVQPRISAPSVRSESSWNSQHALLQNSSRNPLRRKPYKALGRSFFTHLGCNCSCYDKNSLDIDDHVGENNSNRTVNSCGVMIQDKTIAKEPIKNGLDLVDSARINDLGLGSKREDCFSFPVLKFNTRNLAVKVQLQQEEKDGKPRNSLEVFGSPVLEKGMKKPIATHGRKSKMLNWDEAEIHSNPINGMYNDTESDASSDLFEIESLTNSNGNHYLSRQESDGMSSTCVTPTTCYAPSEASIEWSVVTGSIADFSVMSDSEELISSTAKATNLRNVPTAKTSQNKDIQKRRTSLLACKSQKAVRVAGEAYRTSEKAITDPSRCNAADSFSPISKFRAGTNITKFDPRISGRTHSPSASHMLYI